MREVDKVIGNGCPMPWENTWTCPDPSESCKAVCSEGYHTWSKLKLEKDSELGQAIQLHLQSIGKYIHAQDIVDYLKKQEVQEKYGLTSLISLTTVK